MAQITKPTAPIFWLWLIMTTIAAAQSQPQRESLSVQGYSGQAMAMRSQGRVFVDVQDLARLTNGTLSFNPGGVVLTLPACDSSERNVGAEKTSFSRPFMKSAIEAMGAIREWGGILQATVQDRYPVGTPMTGNTIVAYQERAAESVALATAAASTASDYQGLELLKNEFSDLKAWADGLFQARQSLTAQHMTLTDTPLQDDDQVQKIIACGHFLAQMFPSGSFHDDSVCH